MTTAREAKNILEGIVQLACRMSKADPKFFRVKDGGKQRKQVTEKVRIDLYSSVQNIDANINSQRARSGNLIRRSFMIWQVDESSPTLLKILEWDAAIDWDKGYREIWSKKVDDPNAKQEMAQLMSEAINDLIQTGES